MDNQWSSTETNGTGVIVALKTRGIFVGEGRREAAEAAAREGKPTCFVFTLV